MTTKRWYFDIQIVNCGGGGLEIKRIDLEFCDMFSVLAPFYENQMWYVLKMLLSWLVPSYNNIRFTINT